MRSPPARALTDYFFKVRQPLAIQSNARLRGRESCALLQERERRHLRCARLQRAPRQRRASPTGASTRSGRASLARTSGVTPTTDDVGLLLSQTEIHFSRRETSIMVIAVIHCSFPLPAVVTERGHPAPCGAIKSVIPAPLWIASLHAGETPAPPGGAGMRTSLVRQEHARATVGCPGRHAS
jgi:hypothetical protein